MTYQDISSRNRHLSAILYRAFPREMVDEVFAADTCDIDPDFMGFVAVYESLSHIIPPHFAVIDLGCCFAAQCHFFRNHAAYIGVDIVDGPRFRTENTIHYTMSMDDFCRSDLHKTYGDAAFAICSYVPADRQIVRQTFDRLFSYYPCRTASPSGKIGAAKSIRGLVAKEVSK